MKPKVPEVSAEEAFARSASGEAVIVDVRELDEWEAGHIPGAFHIPLAELETRWPELRASDSVIAVCRSATATSALRSVGIDAANLERRDQSVGKRRASPPRPERPRRLR